MTRVLSAIFDRMRFAAAFSMALAVWLFLVGTMPPSLVHTHSRWVQSGPHHAAGANDSHPARAPATAENRHAYETRSEEHGHAHHHHASSDCPSHVSEMADAVRHQHFTWLGFELTFPLSPVDRPQDDRRELQNDFYLQLVDDDASFDRRAGADVRLFAPQASWSEPHALASANSSRFASTPADAHLLCDTARHERSGVLLI